MERDNVEIKQRVASLERMILQLQDELIGASRRIAELEAAGALADQLFAILERNRLHGKPLH